MVRIKVLQGHLPSAQVIWSILLQLILISVVFLLVLIYDLLKDRRIDNVTINQISPFSYMKQIVACVGLFRNGSQQMSKCGKKHQWHTEAEPRAPCFCS